MLSNSKRSFTTLIDDSSDRFTRTFLLAVGTDKSLVSIVLGSFHTYNDALTAFIISYGNAFRLITFVVSYAAQEKKKQRYYRNFKNRVARTKTTTKTQAVVVGFGIDNRQVTRARRTNYLESFVLCTRRTRNPITNVFVAHHTAYIILRAVFRNENNC